VHEETFSKQEYLDTLHGLVRGIQRHMKKVEAPIRCYSGKPRHVREAIRHYGGRIIREGVVLNVGLRDCDWGNCRMCGLSTNAKELTEKELEAELNAIERLPLLDKIESLYISPYSFFSDTEMTDRLREKVYSIINSRPKIKYAVFMTRPNYLNEWKLEKMKATLKKQKIIIWMGAETQNSIIAKYCIDKGYSWNDIERASELLKKFNIKTGVWVLLKPPFVSEKEGIEDATLTIRKALDKGFEIRLMPTEVMDFTVTKLLFEMGKYKPPMLWSVVEVLRQFKEEEFQKIDVSGPHFERDWSVVPREAHSSRIVEFPSNCPKCDKTLFKAILEFNKMKTNAVFDGFDCECKNEWFKELNTPTLPLKERLIEDFSGVIQHFLETRGEQYAAQRFQIDTNQELRIYCQ
jgi:radical SAM enzyme (TIGR01210 family)